MKLVVILLILTGVRGELFFHDIPPDTKEEARQYLERHIDTRPETEGDMKDRYRPDGSQFPYKSELAEVFIEYDLQPEFRHGFLLDAQPSNMYSRGITYTYLVTLDSECQGVIRARLKNASDIVYERHMNKIEGRNPAIDPMCQYNVGGVGNRSNDRCKASEILRRYPYKDGYRLVFLDAFEFRAFLVRDIHGSVFVVDGSGELVDYEIMRIQWLKIIEDTPEYKGRSN